METARSESPPPDEYASHESASSAPVEVIISSEPAESEVETEAAFFSAPVREETQEALGLRAEEDDNDHRDLDGDSASGPERRTKLQRGQAIRRKKTTPTDRDVDPAILEEAELEQVCRRPRSKSVGDRSSKENVGTEKNECERGRNIDIKGRSSMVDLPAEAEEAAFGLDFPDKKGSYRWAKPKKATDIIRRAGNHLKNAGRKITAKKPKEDKDRGSSPRSSTVEFCRLKSSNSPYPDIPVHDYVISLFDMGDYNVRDLFNWPESQQSTTTWLTQAGFSLNSASSALDSSEHS